MTADMKWKLVPVEPTPEMIEAGWLSMGFAARSHPPAAWSAMLAASPPADAEVVARAKEIIANGCGCDRDCERNGEGYCGCLSDAQSVLALAAPPTPSTDAVRQQAREWQPIETAPSDGEPIWVAGGRWEDPTITPADGDWWRHEARNGSKSVPRWWMPVICPEPPAGDDEGGADA